MATKTLYLNSTGVTPSNIHTSTSAYTTPAIAKDGGTYRIAITIDTAKALGTGYAIGINGVKLSYTVYGTRTGVFGSKGKVETGFVSIDGADVYEVNNGTTIGRGSSNATPYTDELHAPTNPSTGKVVVLMKFTNPIAAQTNSFVISNLSMVVDYNIPTYAIDTKVSPSGSGTVSGSGNYEYGKSATLTATANSGYTFSQWNDGVKTNPRTVTVTGNATYTAYFEKIPPPEFKSAQMLYLNKQISSSNKVICKEGFIISVAVT